MAKGPEKAPTLLAQMQLVGAGRRQYRPAFNVLRDQIADALEGGYTLKAVWEFLRSDGRLAMSYSTFRAHCRAAGLRGTCKTCRDAAHGAGAETRSPAVKTKRFMHSSTPDLSAVYGDEK